MVTRALANWDDPPSKDPGISSKGDVLPYIPMTWGWNFSTSNPTRSGEGERILRVHLIYTINFCQR